MGGREGKRERGQVERVGVGGHLLRGSGNRTLGTDCCSTLEEPVGGAGQDRRRLSVSRTGQLGCSSPHGRPRHQRLACLG